MLSCETDSKGERARRWHLHAQVSFCSAKREGVIWYTVESCNTMCAAHTSGWTHVCVNVLVTCVSDKAKLSRNTYTVSLFIEFLGVVQTWHMYLCRVTWILNRQMLVFIADTAVKHVSTEISFFCNCRFHMYGCVLHKAMHNMHVCVCVCMYGSAVFFWSATVPSTAAQEQSSTEPVAEQELWPSVYSRCGIRECFLSSFPRCVYVCMHTSAAVSTMDAP